MPDPLALAQVENLLKSSSGVSVSFRVNRWGGLCLPELLKAACRCCRVMLSKSNSIFDDGGVDCEVRSSGLSRLGSPKTSERTQMRIHQAARIVKTSSAIDQGYVFG